MEYNLTLLRGVLQPLMVITDVAQCTIGASWWIGVQACRFQNNPEKNSRLRTLEGMKLGAVFIPVVLFLIRSC
jgi:hypothetical protein